MGCGHQDQKPCWTHQLIAPRFYQNKAHAGTLGTTVQTRSVQQMAGEIRGPDGWPTGVWKSRNPTTHLPQCFLSSSLLGPEPQAGILSGCSSMPLYY